MFHRSSRKLHQRAMARCCCRCAAATAAAQRHEEGPDQRPHRLHAQAMVDATNHAVEICPSDIVKRRIVTWDGMAAEIVQATP